MVKPASGPPRLRRPPPLESISSDRFKGVRRRSWGRWVSEIRIPHSRDKIWLGSYGSAQQAARAYDIASLLLRGPSCSAFLNFPDSSSLVLSAHPQMAALAAAGMPPSPHTIQVTAQAAAARCSPPAADPADVVSMPSVNDEAAELDHRLPSNCCSNATRNGAAKTSPHSCWIQDVIGLILSPKDKVSPPSGAPQISPSIARSSQTASCSSSSAGYGLPCSNSRECLLYAFCDDFQCPLEGLARDGFTAISAAVTTHKRFDTDTVASACDVDNDSTQLWSYVC